MICYYISSLGTDQCQALAGHGQGDVCASVLQIRCVRDALQHFLVHMSLLSCHQSRSFTYAIDALPER